MDHLVAAATTTVSAALFPSSSSTSTSTLSSSVKLPYIVRRCFLLFFHTILRLLVILLCPLLLPSNPNDISSSPPLAAVSSDTAAARALSHVLNLVACVPVSSRKYHLLRALADRLLDDNLPTLAVLNRSALSSAFSRSLSRLEISIASSSSLPDHRSILSAVRSGLRMWGPAVGIGAESGGGAVLEAEKIAAELLWIAGKIADCGGAGEAVAQWGAAKGLARLALQAEPRLQGALVRVSVFLFRHVNAKQVEEEEKGEKFESSTAQRLMAMLTSWLPLLCRASNGTDAPILTSAERSEIVRVLEETIRKLSWGEQEEVLALWLHHFISCPDSDWPNLESCYTRWYSESRTLLLNSMELEPLNSIA